MATIKIKDLPEKQGKNEEHQRRIHFNEILPALAQPSAFDQCPFQALGDCQHGPGSFFLRSRLQRRITTTQQSEQEWLNEPEKTAHPAVDGKKSGDKASEGRKNPPSLFIFLP